MATYTLISSTTLTGSQTTVTFSSIPSTFTDLVLKISARSDRANAVELLNITFNSNSSAIASTTVLYGNGASVANTRTSDETSTYYNWVDAASSASNIFGSTEIYIPSYTVSQSKPYSSISVQEDNSSTAYISANSNLFRSNSAISRIDITPYIGTNWISGSTFYLYGISNA